MPRQKTTDGSTDKKTQTRTKKSLESHEVQDTHEPVDPVNPVDPVDPVDHVDPVDQVNPVDQEKLVTADNTSQETNVSGSTNSTSSTSSTSAPNNNVYKFNRQLANALETKLVAELSVEQLLQILICRGEQEPKNLDLIRGAGTMLIKLAGTYNPRQSKGGYNRGGYSRGRGGYHRGRGGLRTNNTDKETGDVPRYNNSSSGPVNFSRRKYPTPTPSPTTTKIE